MLGALCASRKMAGARREGAAQGSQHIFSVLGFLCKVIVEVMAAIGYNGAIDAIREREFDTLFQSVI